jgi:hypothetical protein
MLRLLSLSLVCCSLVWFGFDEEGEDVVCDDVDGLSELRFEDCGSFALAALRDNAFAFLVWFITSKRSVLTAYNRNALLSIRCWSAGAF